MKSLHFTSNAIGNHLRKITTGSTVIHVILPDNTTTDLIVGNILLDVAIIINFMSSRNTDGQSGSIMILNKGGSSTEMINDWFGDDIGLTFTSSIVGNNILLNCIVDNSSLDDVYFDYILEKITL